MKENADITGDTRLLKSKQLAPGLMTNYLVHVLDKAINL